MAAIMKRKGDTLTEAAPAGTGCAGEGDGEDMTEGIGVVVGMGIGVGVVCADEGTGVNGAVAEGKGMEGETEGAPGEGDCPKFVGA